MSTPNSKSTQAPSRRHRRVTPELAQAWFERHDRGETVAQIARKEERDLRTVRDAVASVTADVEKNMVRREAMKEALKEHFGKLIDDVEELGRRAGATDIPQMENLWVPGTGPWRLRPYEFVVTAEPSPGVGVEYEAEGSVRWEMLTSHLKGDMILRRFGEWKRAVGELSGAMIEAKRFLVTGLEDMGGVSLDSEADRRLNVSGVRLIHDAVVNQAFGRQPNLESVIGTLNTGQNGLRISSHLLFAGVDDPDALAGRVSRWLGGAVFGKQVARLTAAAMAVRDSGSGLSKEAEYVAAVPFPGGDCRACRRLGH